MIGPIGDPSAPLSRSFFSNYNLNSSYSLPLDNPTICVIFSIYLHLSLNTTLYLCPDLLARTPPIRKRSPENNLHRLKPRNSKLETLKPMAGYFSNHSQSRFLANSQTNTTSGTGGGSSGTTTTTSGQAPTTPSNPTTPQRPARVPSRHFSTSLSTSSSSDEKSNAKEKLGALSGAGGGSTNGASVHPLKNTYVRNVVVVLIFEFY